MPNRTLLKGRYELDKEPLGRGGYGRVWRGYDHSLGRHVAVKEGHEPVYTQADADRFFREGKALAQVNSPYVVQVYDTLVDAESAFLVMELVEGRSLRKVLADERIIPLLYRVADWAEHIFRGLHAAHRVDVVHRDIKPENIMIDNEGTAKLVDFGIAAFADTGSSRHRGAGSAAYASPERCKGQRGDHRSDLYSAGCVLYEMLTGTTPFRTPGALPSPLYYMQAHVHEPVTPPSVRAEGIPDRLDRLVQRLLEKNPADRPQDALRVVESIHASVFDDQDPGHGPRLDPQEVDFQRTVSDPQPGWSPDSLDAQREIAELSGRSGDVAGAVRILTRLAEEYTRLYGVTDQRALDAWEAMARWEYEIG